MRCRRQALRFPVSSLILTVQIIFLIGLVLQIFGLHAPLLPLILRLLCVANRSICLEHNAAGGHVPLSCISPSNTQRTPLTHIPLLISQTFTRKITRSFLGPNSFDGSELSVIPIHSRDSPRRLRTHVPARALNGMRTIS